MTKEKASQIFLTNDYYGRLKKQMSRIKKTFPPIYVILNAGAGQ
jgi:hypothetical protein